MTEKRELYAGPVIQLNRESFQLPDGTETVYDVARHAGGAAALPILDDDRVVLIRQYRPVIGKYIYEIPAGRLEPGETPLATIKRELKEEVGMVASSYQEVWSGYSTPGFCDEHLTIYLARGIEEGEATPEAGEFIEPVKILVADLRGMLNQGDIVDAKTHIAISAFLLDLNC